MTYMRRYSISIILMLAASIAQAEAPQQQLNQTLQTLADTKKNEAALKQRLEKTNAEIDTLAERATGLAERLQVSERRVSAQEQSLAQVNDELATTQADFDTRKADYAATVLNLLRMRELPPSAFFASSDTLETMMQTASVLEKTNAALAAKATRLRRDTVRLRDLQATAKERGARTRSEKASLAVEQQNLAHAITDRQRLQAKLSADHARAEEKVGDLSRQSQSLQELIGKLEENAREQAAAAKRAAKPVKKETMRNFDGRKGSLRAPVAGDIIHHYGERKNANETYRGLVYRARANATVVAPYDGEVVFTGPFRDYGRMVLIKHKNGYISLIAGLGDVTASLNQNVIRGEPLGTMPGTAGSEAYVELRDKDAKPIDPGDWFANVAGN